jgi:AraC-like DNA-binding protein
LPMQGWRKLRKAEARHGPIRAAIARLYGKHGNLEAVANELGVSRVTLYRYLGKEEIGMLKAQATMAALENTVQEISIGIEGGRL